MKIVYVSKFDLVGQIFNGYCLMNSLNDIGHKCNQLVFYKQGRNENVEEVLSQKEKYLLVMLRNLEMECGAVDLFYPFGEKLIFSEKFKTADIVHFQLFHNKIISMYNLKKLLTQKTSVWTIHDPWIFTGHCVHPLECEQWKFGCKHCERGNDHYFPLYANTADQMWEIKRSQLENVDIDIIVSTDFMLHYVKNSPITAHFTKVHKIPFGVDLSRIKNYEKAEAKKLLGIPETNMVIGVRDEEDEIKGVKLFLEALKKIGKNNLSILTVGGGRMLENFDEKLSCIRLGIQMDVDKMDLFYSASDIFVMPSLAESFGLMAIEAMAHECAVVCFKDTVLAEITDAGRCGLAAEYKNADSLAEKIKQLLVRKEEREARGKLGRKIVAARYRYDDYVRKHIALYQNILEEKK